MTSETPRNTDHPPPPPFSLPPTDPAPSMEPAPSGEPQPSTDPSTKPQPSTDPQPSPIPSTDPQPSPSPSPPPPPPPAAPNHTRCGWTDDPIAEQSFVANAAWFTAIHPKWYQVDPSGNVKTVGTPDLPSLVTAAKNNHVKLMPMIDNPDADRLRIIWSSASKIAAHVSTLVSICQSKGYAGMDIDYEHLWTASDRPGLSALSKALSKGFHDAGLEISFAVAPIGHDSGNNGYDFQVLADSYDVVHFMDYDYHYPGGDHVGPIAPLGWIDSSFQRAVATGHPEKFMLGLPNYAIGLGWYDWLKTGMAACVASVVETTTEMISCPYNEWGYSAGLSPHCLTNSHGTIWYEDLASMEEKIALAKSYGARGVTYWTVGNEISGFFPLIKKYYP